MFLLRILDLLALTTLFVQTFVAWTFVAVLMSMGQRRGETPRVRSFARAFLVLALALTVMSLRFFRAHDVGESRELWDDGMLRPSIAYAAYMGLKASFALHLVAGSRELAGDAAPAWMRRVGWPVIALMAASPALFPAVDELLIVQAPVMIVCAALARRALGPLLSAGSGIRLVRASLLGLALTWAWHAVVILSRGHLPVQRLLSLNSLIDLGVQLTLGIGLVMSLLQDAHGQRLAAERERETLRRAVEHDDKLRALGSVVSGVAHELNNPLTVIMGYAELLATRFPDDPGAAVIGEQAQRCHGIVRNLSALASQSVHPRERIDLEELARRVARGLAHEAEARDLRIVIEPMHGLCCDADRVGLEQVLANLTLNGLHASPPGGRVTLAGRRCGSGVEILVSDEGPGVDPQLRQRLFEPFFTTKSPGEGTGLGLSIAHAIVRSHGGTIDLSDPPEGGGAVFRVALPEQARTPEAEVSPPRPTVASGPGRLLVVDDEPGVRAIVRAQAERLGWETHEASSAEEALTRPLADYGAILCDLRMPGMGGTGFHDHLLSESPRVLEHVVFVTGDLASPDVAEFSARCKRPLLGKPFLFEELARHLPEPAAR